MPSKLSYTFRKSGTDILQRYGKRVAEQGQGEIQASADRAYAMAQSLCASDTGETKSKMRKEIGNLQYEVGFLRSDFPEGFVPGFLEFGTSDTPAHPCIIPTSKAERPKLKAGIARVMGAR